MTNLVGPAVAAGALSSGPQPALSGDGLTLRPWRDSDASVVARALGDPEIQRWFMEAGGETEARAWIAARRGRWRRETGADWAVCDGETVHGRVALVRVNLRDGYAEVGYWMLPEARGTGVASQALARLCDWAFTEVGLHRLELFHSVANAGSCGLATRGGFALEGTARERMLHGDGLHDMHLHARLAGDPAPGQT